MEAETPGTISLQERLLLFRDSAVEEMRAAATSAYQALSPSPLYETHTIIVLLSHNPLEVDISVAFRVRGAELVLNSELPRYSLPLPQPEELADEKRFRSVHHKERIHFEDLYCCWMVVPDDMNRCVRLPLKFFEIDIAKRTQAHESSITFLISVPKDFQKSIYRTKPQLSLGWTKDTVPPQVWNNLNDRDWISNLRRSLTYERVKDLHVHSSPL